MASRALYLKWRPQRFEDVVGQEHITQTLKNALRAGRLAHAYLFAGPRGTGKTTMARLLAKAVNCLDEDVTNRPCNKCTICRSINEGRLLDLIEMDAASHTGVDNVREAIRDKVGFRPTQARRKVYVIDEVHMLSTSAFNALLKTLEEPPEHVVFCLATTEPHRVLPTVLSRCQRFDFRRIPLSALVGRLQYIADREGIRVEERALLFIARTSTGSARDAISLLDQLGAYGDETITVERIHSLLGLGDPQLVRELVTHMVERDIGRGLDVINTVVQQGADIRQFTQQVVDYVRSLLLLRVGGDAVSLDVDAQTRAYLDTLAGTVSIRGLVRSIKLINQAQLDLRGSDQNQLALELAFVEAAMKEDELTAAKAPPLGTAQPPSQRTETERAAQSASRVIATSGPPAAPPRSVPNVGNRDSSEPGVVEPREMPEIAHQMVEVSLEEVHTNWNKIVQTIKATSPSVATFVNSASARQVRNGNQVVLEFPGARNDPGYNFSARKLEEEGNKRVVERALSSVLGRSCRVRCEVRGGPSSRSLRARSLNHRAASQKPAESSADNASVRPGVGNVEVASAESITKEHASDPYQDAVSDPIVQDLISRGGRVTGVQTWAEE